MYKDKVKNTQIKSISPLIKKTSMNENKEHMKNSGEMEESLKA